VQQVECGDPVDLAALKAEVVADLDETGDQCSFELRIGDVFAGRVLAFGRRTEKRSAAGEVTATTRDSTESSRNWRWTKIVRPERKIETTSAIRTPEMIPK